MASIQLPGKIKNINCINNNLKLSPFWQVLNGSYEAPYTNPKGPVHFVTGSAGCKERTDNFRPRPYWSAFTNSDYGYTRLTAFNATHLYWEQVMSYFFAGCFFFLN